jgi:hypothetical protein
VPEGYSTEDQRSVVQFSWSKGLITKDNRKEIFPAYCWKCLSCRAVHNWVDKFSQGRSKVADDARPGAEVAETTNISVLRVSTYWQRDVMSASVFAEDMSRNKCFKFRISHVLHFTSTCDLFTDSSSYQPRMVVDVNCSPVGGMRIGSGNRSIRRKLPHCHVAHQKSHMT